MRAELPPLLPVAEIQKRLREVFPEGTPNRGYCTREIAARTVFVMLYVGAVDGTGVYVRPNQVTRMTNAQADRTDDVARHAWAKTSLSKEAENVPGRWYAVDTREPIRDETLRDGLVPTGAVSVKPNIPTTSSAPRYALAPAFAALFNPRLKGAAFQTAAAEWQAENLSASALARIQILGRGAVATAHGVMVTFPNGETRRLAAGPSSIITKAVVEEFSKRFLAHAGVIFLSESGNKVVQRDETLAKAIGLAIPADRFLPDILLVDLGPKHPLLVFVEVVATDGPITAGRRQALLDITRAGGFADNNVAFVTAYLDRSHASFKKTVSELAWNSFAWFAAEPDHIVLLREGGVGKSVHLSQLL
jgi:hypothetical protein